MCNQDIREAARSNGICLWRIAERFGVNDGNFSRKLRREFSPADKARALAIIDELSREGSSCRG